MMHRCKCRSCAPDVFPDRPQDPDAAYVAPYRNYRGAPWWRCYAVVNGEAWLQEGVIEARAGKHGWVVCANREAGCIHECRCGSANCCSYVQYGTVEIRVNWNSPRKTAV
jgi:hypothetical protein